ncbi:Rasa2 [Phodopus roborovskii]|uniref:Rasa2 protein n=1 Tax=Phodopus roborovskii TaxID=109678 RepID=A0AAU9YR83_PHORO|nr:Rasa2 [Phodopus roborovskii]
MAAAAAAAPAAAAASPEAPAVTGKAGPETGEEDSRETNNKTFVENFFSFSILKLESCSTMSPKSMAVKDTLYFVLE